MQNEHDGMENMIFIQDRVPRVFTDQFKELLTAVLQDRVIRRHCNGELK